MTIRSFLVLGFLFLFLIIFLPVHLVVWLIGLKNPTLKYKISEKIIHWAFSCCIWLNGVKIEVINKEVVPEDEPVLYVSNHRSYWDILVLHNTIHKPVGFVAKIEMEKFPILNWWMGNIGCIFLDREDPRKGLKAILQGADYINSGHSMVICPEGTRNHKDEMLEFKEGSLKMAQKTKCKIIPVALIGTDDLLEKNPGFRMRKGKVTVIFGEPFYMSDVPAEHKKTPAAYTQDIIKDMLAKHKENI